MKKTLNIIAIATLLSACSSAGMVNLPIKEQLNSKLAKEKLNPNIELSFGKKSVKGKTIGTWTSNKKTNNVGKSIPNSCGRAFTSALISLQARAVKEGGNAVVNIHSYYKKNPYWSNTEFQCMEGHIMSGVALRGTVIKK